jgi:hypothetical protein
MFRRKTCSTMSISSGATNMTPYGLSCCFLSLTTSLGTVSKYSCRAVMVSLGHLIKTRFYLPFQPKEPDSFPAENNACS